MERQNGITEKKESSLRDIVDKSRIEITWDSEKELYKVKMSYQTDYGNFPDNYWIEKKWCCYNLIGEVIDNLYTDMLWRETNYKQEKNL